MHENDNTIVLTFDNTFHISYYRHHYTSFNKILSSSIKHGVPISFNTLFLFISNYSYFKI